MTTSPFKFLDSYTREDIGSFFGRERETGELFRLCFTAPILVVYGGSGTGKTSLVQCGLQSKFNESDWLPILVRRSGDLLASLGDAVAANTITPIKSADLGEQVANLYLDHFKPIYFLFDQFEELFIFGTHAESEAFFTAIKKLLEKERNAHVIFIVREEYLAELTRYERIIPGLIENRYRVERMARSHAMEVVEKLCAANSISCAAGFSAAMVDRLNPEGQGVELSYLQVYLDRCWRTRQNDEPFSIALLERIGYVDDLLGAFLDEQVADTPDPQRAENLLKAFVSDQGTKRQLTAGEAHEWVNAIGTAMEPTEVDRLLQVFVAKRLLKDRDERGRYELLHDALARQIFQRITRAEQELIEVRQFVQQAFGQFQKRGVKLTANDLGYLRPYRSQLHLKGDVSAFVEGAFGEEAKQVRRRSIRRALLLLALIVVLVIGATFTAHTMKRLSAERRLNESNRLSQLAMECSDIDPLSAYLLAEEAWRLDTNLNAERAMLKAYNGAYAEIARYPGVEAIVSPDRSTFTVVDFDKFAVYDGQGHPLFQGSIRKPDAYIHYLGTGQHLLVADSTVRIYDRQGGILDQRPLKDWRRICAAQDIIGTTREGHVMLVKDRITVKPWSKEVPYELFNSASVVSWDDDGSVYLLGEDSITVVSVTGELEVGRTFVNPLHQKIDGGDIQFLIKDGIVLLGQGHEVFVLDQRDGVWQELDQMAQRPVDFKGRSTFTYGMGSPFASMKNARPHVYSLTGYYSWSDPHGDLVLTRKRQPNATERSFMLFDVDLVPTVARHPSLSPEERWDTTRADGVIGLFKGTAMVTTANGGFGILSPLSPGTERFTCFSNKGVELGHLDIPQVAEVMGMSYSKGLFTDTTSAGDLVICAFHDAVIGGEKQRQCRIFMGQKVVFSTIVSPEHAFGEGYVFQIVSDSVILFGRQPDGLGLLRLTTERAFAPYDPDMTYVAVGSIGYVAHSILEPTSISDGIRVESYLNGERASAKITVEEAGLEDIVADPSHHDIWGVLSEDGRFIALTVSKTQRRLDGYFSNEAHHVVVCDVRTGKRYRSSLIADAKELLRVTGTGSFFMLTNDSLRVVDATLDHRICAVPLDSMVVLNAGESGRLILAHQRGAFRIIDVVTGTVESISVDSARMGYFLPELDNFTHARWLNDSTIALFMSQNALSGIQLVTNGIPGPLSIIRGNLDEFNTDGIQPYVSVWDYNIRGSGVWLDRHAEDDRLNYFKIQLVGNTMKLIPTTMSDLAIAEKEYRVERDRSVMRWQHRLLSVDGRLFDTNLPEKVLASHHLLTEFEEFPQSARAAIKMVREDKMFGEFWNHIDIAPLLKQALQ